MRLIDADKLYDEAPKWLDGTVLVMPVTAIDDAPTVEPQIIHKPTPSEFKRMAVQLGYVKREKGEWQRDGDGRFTCSVCKEEATSFDDVYRDFEVSWCTEDFCPHCGADMRGEQK